MTFDHHRARDFEKAGAASRRDTAMSWGLPLGVAGAIALSAFAVYGMVSERMAIARGSTVTVTQQSTPPVGLPRGR
jgi:hypothetical protein